MTDSPSKPPSASVATDTVWLLARTEVKGPDDVTNVNALQDRMSLTSVQEWAAGRRNSLGGHTYSPWPAYDVSDPLNFFSLLNEGLKRNPPQGSDLVMLGLFESLNIGPNKTFDPKTLDEATAAGLRRAVDIGPRILTADFSPRLGRSINIREDDGKVADRYGSLQSTACSWPLPLAPTTTPKSFRSRAQP